MPNGSTKSANGILAVLPNAESTEFTFAIAKLALFVSFFPQLVQGPISRFDALAKTLYEEHRFEWKTVSFVPSPQTIKFQLAPCQMPVVNQTANDDTERFPKADKAFAFRVFRVLRTILLMSSLRMFDCY